MKISITAAVSAALLVSVPVATAALWTEGHGDFVLSYSASPSPAFSYTWKVGTGGDSATVDGIGVSDATYSATALTPRVGPATIASPDPSLTGGSPLGLIPQDAIDAGRVGSPFQGWSAGLIPAGLFASNQIRLVLTGIAGPGHVSLWLEDGFGTSAFRWSSFNGFSTADTLTLGVGGHSHYNLGFTEPGEYSLQVLAQANLATGGDSVATPLTLQYSMIPEGSTSLLIFVSAALLSLRFRHPASH